MTQARGVLAVLAVASTMLSVPAAAAPRPQGTKTIGVMLWSDEPRYRSSLEGILDELKKAGYVDPKIKLQIERAEGKKAKAAEIAARLEAARLDLVIAVGTSAAVAVVKDVKDSPVVYSMVFDPVDAKIAASWKTSGNNATGASPRVPMDLLLGTLKQLAPVKTLAVLYTPGERNSEAQLKELQAAQAAAKIKVLPVQITSKESVASVMADVVGGADAVYLTGSASIGESVGTITNLANRARLVTVTHLEDHAEAGVLLGVSANPRLVGRLAGEKAVRILKGAKPADIPIEGLKTFDVLLNMKSLKASQIALPASFRKLVTRTIE